MSWISDIFLPNTAQTSDEATANLARQQAQFNERLAAREAAGTISDSKDSEYHAFIGGTSLVNQDAAALEGFQQGWAEGFNNLKSTAQDAIKSVSPAIWGVVVLALIGLFLYAGGLGLVRGILKRS